jgi:nitrite reductase (cytochrome c-552)
MKYARITAALALAIAAGAALAAAAADGGKSAVDMESVNNARFKNLDGYYKMWMDSKSDADHENMIATHPGLAILQADGETPTGASLNNLRGHYYAWYDFAAAAGTKDIGSRCLLCHSSSSAKIIQRDGELELLSSTWGKYAKESQNTVGCANCHDTKTFALKLTPPWVNRELKKAGLKTFEESSLQDKKILLCAQCHYEDYRTHVKWKDASGKERDAAMSNAPWKNGMTLDQMEAFYNDGRNFEDGKPYYDMINPISKAKVVMVEHPDFELFKVGVHGMNGLACTDCHMAKDRKTGVTNHKIGNPLDNFENTCARCHDKPKAFYTELLAKRKAKAMKLRDEAVVLIAQAHLDAGAAWKAGATEKEMEPVLADIRSAYFKMNGLNRANYFHSTEEAFNGLADALFKAGRARTQTARILAAHGVKDYVTPEFKTQDEAEKLVGTPHRLEAIKAQCADFARDVPAMQAEARKAGLLDEEGAHYEGIKSWLTDMCPKPEAAKAAK